MTKFWPLKLLCSVLSSSKSMDTAADEDSGFYYAFMHLLILQE